MATQYRAHVFSTDDWEPVDSYWSSPLSYWAKKSLQADPPVPLRVTTLGRVVDETDEGWINYGGLSAMFVHTVWAKGTPGQRIRMAISDEPIETLPAEESVEGRAVPHAARDEDA
ncbi:MAG: hypothetical protein D6705_00100 [Deltaproteobacteria bacterium]|nr:MAG: hypothetical protein D6705_00100 [Deltaproteobacteria bacterium]